MPSIPDCVGLLGVILIIVSYFFMQIRKLRADGVLFSALNTLGSLSILFSLFFNWNLPAAIVEILWAGISIFGIFKALTTPLQPSKGAV